MHVPLRYTKARSLHLACLKTPPTARGFAMIGCRLSSHWILTFTSLAESSSYQFVILDMCALLDGYNIRVCIKYEIQKCMLCNFTDESTVIFSLLPVTHMTSKYCNSLYILYLSQKLFESSQPN